MKPTTNFLIGLILLTIGFYHLLTFPNVTESLYMVLFIVLCNSIGGFNIGVGIAKIFNQ